MAFVPESPRWLVLRGKEAAASESLEWLRGRRGDAIGRELEKIKRDIEAKKRESASVAQLKNSWWPFLVSLVMMLLLQTRNRFYETSFRSKSFWTKSCNNG
jgi:hypothetical protein